MMEMCPNYQTRFTEFCWYVPKFLTVTKTCSKYFTLDGLSENIKFKLKLRLKLAESINNFRYELFLVSKTRNIFIKNPANISLAVQDKFHKRNIQNVRSFQGEMNSPLLLWSVRRSDLLANCNISDLVDSLTIIFKFNPSYADIENKKVKECVENSSVSSLFQDFLMYLVHNKQSDVVIKCGDRLFLTNSSLLSSHSSVFAAIPQHGVTDKFSKLVYIKDVECTHFEQFLEYLTSDRLSNLSKDNVQHLHVAGMRYDVRGLQKLYVNFMMDHINVENALQLLVIADNHGDADQKKEIINFIVENDVILRNKNWVQFIRNHTKLSCDVFEAHENLAL